MNKSPRGNQNKSFEMTTLSHKQARETTDQKHHGSNAAVLQNKPRPQIEVEMKVRNPPKPNIRINPDNLPQRTAAELRQATMQKVHNEIQGAQRNPVGGSSPDKRDLAAVMQDARTGYRIDRPGDTKNFVKRAVNSSKQAIKNINAVSTLASFVPGLKEIQKFANARQLSNQASALSQNKQNYSDAIHPLMDSEIKSMREKSSVNKLAVVSGPLGSVKKGYYAGRDFATDTSRTERIEAAKDMRELNQPKPQGVSYGNNEVHRKKLADSRNEHLANVAVQDPEAREKILNTIDSAKTFSGDDPIKELQHHTQILKPRGKDSLNLFSSKVNTEHNMRPSSVAKQVQSEAAINRIKPNRN